MKSRFLLSIIFVVGLFTVSLASDITKQDAKELLELVETSKDYDDAIDLISSADNADELTSNERLRNQVASLAEKLDKKEPNWNGDEAHVDEGAEPEDGEKDEDKQSSWSVFFLAFFSGFAALIMPCVFPMIPSGAAVSDIRLE